MTALLAEVDLAISQNAVYIGLGTVGLLLVGAVTATAKVISILSSIDNRLKELEQKVDGSYSREEASNHAMELAMANPRIRVPRLDAPGRYYPTTQEKAVTDT